MKDLSCFLREVADRCPQTVILESEPLSAHCSFRIGGCCDAMLLPGSVEEVQLLCRLLAEEGEAPFLMGNGTNLLFPDEPLRRVVIRLGDGFSAAEFADDDCIRAQSGITLTRLATLAAAKGLAGLEFAHGIPGTLGGAIVMNAGAYGGEMKDVLVSAVYLDESYELRESGELALSYRHSRFSETRDIVLGGTVRLRPDREESIRERMEELSRKRRTSQPLDMPSAGSTFKRPAGGYAAALIDQAGLRGYTIGGAQISEKHTGFVVNRGGATCRDVLALMDHIQKEVLRTSGILLEPEVRIIRN